MNEGLKWLAVAFCISAGIASCNHRDGLVVQSCITKGYPVNGCLSIMSAFKLELEKEDE